MHKRGMTAYESTMFLLLIAFLLAGTFSYAAQQLNISRKTFSNAAFERSLSEIYRKAELLPSGSQGSAKIFVPGNISQASVEAEGEEWVLRLMRDGREYRKTSRVKLVFVPEDLLKTAGTHTILIRKESDKSAAILEMQ